MSNPLELHPGDGRLVQFAAGELPEPDATAVERHLTGCARCMEEVSAIRLVISQLETTHHADKQQAPPPPEPWFDLRERLQQLDAGHSVLPRRKPLFSVTRRWAAVAAGIAAAFLLYRATVDRPLSAAELLREASRQEAVASRTSATTRTIRIRSSAGGRAVLRPARLDSGAGAATSDLPARFAAANFSWEEPLSARAFSRWRDSLREKEDRVDSGDRSFEVTTTTAENTLASASITIRADDMKAISETFRFRDGLEVEITEAGQTHEGSEPHRPENADSDAVPPVELAKTPEELKVTAADELRVLATLNAIGADLGEPVEVQRDEEGISVHVLGGSAQRREQIRSALDSLPGIEVTFEDPQPVRDSARKAAPETSTQFAGGPLVEQLRSSLPAGADIAAYTDDILLASEGATARAFALRNLAERFPPATEDELSALDRQTLHQLVTTHAAGLRQRLSELDRLLQPLPRGGGFAASAGHAETWQAEAEAVLRGAQELDRLVNQALATPGASVDLNAVLVSLTALRIRIAELPDLLARAR
jgi:hypothetical protein